jgi:hypothetical protein
MIYTNGNSTIDRFRSLHSEIIQFYQCIEFDLRRIYSAMSSDDFFDCMDELSDKNWGTLLNRLEELDYSDDDPYFAEEEYRELDEIRSRRNYWCHQCYLDFIYIQDNWKQEERLQRLIRQLENERNRAYKLHRRMQDIYLNDFRD